MSLVTLEAIQAKQSELQKLIAQFSEQASLGREIETDGCTITLEPGEHYAGAVLDDNGEHMHHLVVMAARPSNKLTWKAALDWAEEVGGALPTRQELALIYANCKPYLKPDWHWSCEEHESNSSYAWVCGFDDGYQDYGREDDLTSAVSVRRL